MKRNRIEILPFSRQSRLNLKKLYKDKFLNKINSISFPYSIRSITLFTLKEDFVRQILQLYTEVIKMRTMKPR